MDPMYRNKNVEKILNGNPFMEKEISLTPNKPTVHTVKCTGALSGETPVLISQGYSKTGNEFAIKSIGELSIKYGDHDLPAYGAGIIEDEKKSKVIGVAVVPTMIYNVPKRVSMPEIVGIGFSNGITLTCSPTTGIMEAGATGKYIKASDIKVGDKVSAFKIIQEQRQIIPMECHVLRVQKEFSLVSVGSLFVSMTGNILVTKVEDGQYEFIVVQQ